MGGSTAAVLSGWATPASVNPRWDHTYVVSSCGWIWRCWGAYNGGKVLRSAPGNSFVANCLSKQNGTAGILYGVTGVCHQTANRILDGTGLRVDKARGYYTSESMWGPFGAGVWPRRNLCQGLQSTDPVMADYDGVTSQNSVKRKGSEMGNERLTFAMDGAVGFDDQAELIEIRAMVKATLPEPLTPFEERILLEIRFWMRREQRRLRDRLEAREIRSETYLDGIEDITLAAMRRNHDVLGEARFIEVFGEAGFEPSGLVDREIFAAHHGAN